MSFDNFNALSQSCIFKFTDLKGGSKQITPSDLTLKEEYPLIYHLIIL